MLTTALDSNPYSAAPGFWGRAAAIREIVEVLARGSGRLDGNVCVVHGEEGIGKTELLLNLRGALRAEYPDAQIYINLNYLESDPLGIEKTIAKIIHTLSPYALLVDSLAELRALYLAALDGKRILILLDDVFSSDLVSLLTPPATCALIVATKQRLESQAVYQIALPELAPDEAETVLLELCPRIGALARLAAEFCGLRPLALRLTAALLNASPELGITEFLDELQGIANRSTANAHSEMVVEHLIARVYALQSPTAREQLRRLSILQSRFSEPIAALLVGAAPNGGNEIQVQAALESFVGLGFLNVDDRAQVFQMHPLVRRFAVSQLEHPGAIWLDLADFMERRASEFKTLAETSSDGFILSLALFDDYAMCLDELGRWVRDNAQNPQVGAIPFKLVGVASLFGRLRFLPRKELIPWFQDACEYALRVNDRENVLALLTDLHRAYERLDDESKAQAYLQLRQEYEQQNEQDEGMLAQFIERLERVRASESRVNETSGSVFRDDPPGQSQTPYNMGKANIVLTGFMGSGKTTVGKQLAELLGYQFIDTDELIEGRFGRSIADIFSEMGEAAFRQIERDIAQELSTREKLVISTGGRLMLDPVNVEALSQQGRVFCLVATPQEILTRVSNDSTHQRPLLAVPNPEERIVELLQERSDKYRRFPQVITDQIKPLDVAQNLIGLINTDPKHFVIDQTTASYGFIVGAGLLPFIRQLANLQGPAVVITERQVRELYGPCFTSVEQIIELPGEGREKNLSSVEKVYEELLELGFDRTGTIISLGGSGVGDVAGFVAATYMRGVNLVHCPTSLIAMIDTSIGGKTGLDLPTGKNIIGVYKQPSHVIADVTTLQTLSPRAFASGMAEVIKHGLLAESELLAQVERGVWNSIAGEPHLSIAELQMLVAQAIQVKISIVQEDPFEHGRRSILNLGHTFGYAIEQVSRNAFTHGESVGLGLVAVANLSARLGYLERGMQRRIETALQQFNLPTRIPNNLSPEALLQAMYRDKKKQGKQLHFILLRGIGDVFVADNVPQPAILETLRELENNGRETAVVL